VAAIRAWAREREDKRLEHILDLALTIPLEATGPDCETLPSPNSDMDLSRP
jgi:hypothetical protein